MLRLEKEGLAYSVGTGVDVSVLEMKYNGIVY